MPGRRKKERVIGRFFTWLLGNRNGIFFADGRSNTTNLGRHSLGTRDKDDALKLLVRLDLVKAVEHGRADRVLLEPQSSDALSLEEGQRLYLAHVGRPPVLGGSMPATGKRYRAVLNKFVPFAHANAISAWPQVSKAILEAYGAWLDDEGYNYATEYLELTTLKQAMKWLASEKHIPASCLFALPLRKPQGTSTYCYTQDEVQAMVDHCFTNEELSWLGAVIVALATTGLRIGELAGLLWADVDLEHSVIHLTDSRFRGRKTDREGGRTTKSHRDRSLPIHPHLRRVLDTIGRHHDGRIFHGPRGGALKPDTVRNVLIREVLVPLATRFPARRGSNGFANGRLHSYRHYFCSMSANSNVPEQVLMTWLGHQESKMVRHYYHLHQEEAQRQMSKIDFVHRSKEIEGPCLRGKKIS